VVADRVVCVLLAPLFGGVLVRVVVRLARSAGAVCIAVGVTALGLG
jgi:hypothetical protein